MKEELKKEKKDLYVALSRVTVLHPWTLDLTKREEVTLKAKEEVKK